MKKLIRFTDDASILIHPSGVRFFLLRPGDKTIPHFQEAGIVFEEGENIRDGVVHLRALDGVYEVQHDEATGFVVQKLLNL
ncbi:hypothetical protein [Roseibium sp.]|uniref:hypothetical protein n=1 Tax=Roseibium sp. TaxID=1936156 RepID=UPI003BB0EB30